MAEKSQSLEEFLAEFRKLPDWQNYPLPEICYTKYGLPRPKPNLDLQDALWAQLSPPPHEFLGIENREKAPGGVREIQLPEVPLLQYEPAEPAEPVEDTTKVKVLEEKEEKKEEVK